MCDAIQMHCDHLKVHADLYFKCSLQTTLLQLYNITQPPTQQQAQSFIQHVLLASAKVWDLNSPTRGSIGSSHACTNAALHQNLGSNASRHAHPEIWSLEC